MPVSIGQFICLCMQNTEAWQIWYAIEQEPVRLESTNPKKKFPDLGIFPPSKKKKKNLICFFGGGYGTPLKSIHGLGIFF